MLKPIGSWLYGKLYNQRETDDYNGSKINPQNDSNFRETEKGKDDTTGKK